MFILEKFITIMNLKKVLFLLLSGIMVNAYSAPKFGCDYLIGGKSQGTIYGKSCKDITWYYADGTKVPTDEIVCCNWSGDYFTGVGGINCPFGKPKNPNDISGTNYIGNLYLDSEIKIANDVSNGNVVLVDYTTALSLVLLTPEQMLGNDINTHIQFGFENNILKVYFSPVNDSIVVDSNGFAIGAMVVVFDLEDVRQRLYQTNILNIVSVSPNPIPVNSSFQIINKLDQYGKDLELRIYDINGVCYGTHSLYEQYNLLPGLPHTGLYRFIIFDARNGNQLGYDDYGFINVLGVAE
jgi:hypothetical protein